MLGEKEYNFNDIARFSIVHCMSGLTDQTVFVLA